MSKSDPNSAIFMEDSEKDVKTKIKKAYCPPGIIEKNPCLDYVKNIIFGSFEEFKITRKPENGGDITYKSYQDLEKDYKDLLLHPGDLKAALTDYLN